MLAMLQTQAEKIRALEAAVRDLLVRFDQREASLRTFAEHAERVCYWAVGGWIVVTLVLVVWCVTNQRRIEKLERVASEKSARATEATARA